MDREFYHANYSKINLTFTLISENAIICIVNIITDLCTHSTPPAGGGGKIISVSIQVQKTYMIIQILG